MREGSKITLFAGLSNSKDEGEIGRAEGGMGLGRKAQSLTVGIPIKHPSEMLSGQVDV